MSKRLSFIQEAQENIKRQMLEQCCDKEFFRDLNILTADKGDLLTEIEKVIGSLGLVLVIEVTGGPMPIIEQATEWNASINIIETPTLARGENSDGKTADVVLDAVLRAFANGGYFVGKTIKMTPTESGIVIYTVEGTTDIILKTKPCILGQKATII